MYLTPNIGVAGFPDDALDTTTLIKCAISASVQPGEQGAGHLQFYSAEMNAASMRRYRFEAGLRNAIDNDAFRLLYQPKSLRVMSLWINWDLSKTVHTSFTIVIRNSRILFVRSSSRVV